jgi:hypothetical protein
MSHQPPPFSIVLPGHSSALHELLVLFEEESLHLEKAIQFTQADFQRMLLLTRNGADLLNQLKKVPDLNSNLWEKPAPEELPRQVAESLAVFGQARQQIQFYDILQQQLDHIVQIHQLSAAEVRACLEAKGNPPATSVQYLYALAEIVQLHTLQLSRIREQYELEIVSWQTQLQQTVEKLAQSYKKSASSKGGNASTDQSNQNPLRSPQQLVADIADGWQIFCQQALSPDQFGAAIAAGQTVLAQIAKGGVHLSLAADPPARSSVLRRIREGYTMQSERSLHDQVLARLGTDAPIPASQPSQAHNTQEIELF